MEVHAHTHTKRKKWTHYVWEFLMLFLAVFCGFLAENQREHYVEHKREKQYIRSLISDVKTDTTNITRWIRRFGRIERLCDTLLNNFDDHIKYFSKKNAEKYFYVLDGYPDFIYTDRTIQQLKNSGGMRLIRNASAVDSIIAYDAAVRDILIEETGITQYYDQLNNLTNRMFSFRRFTEATRLTSPDMTENEKTNFWITQDDGQFEHLYNLVYKYRQIVQIYSEYLFQLKKRGTRLVSFLQQEYKMI